MGDHGSILPAGYAEGMVDDATNAPTDIHHVDHIATNGYTIVPDVLAANEIATLIETLDRLQHDLGIVACTNGFEGFNTVRIYNLLARGAVFQHIATHPMVLPIIEGVLDNGCLMSSASSIAIGPGESAQPIHADDQIMPIPKPHPAVVCNSMWALTDFTAANGATRIMPGTHLAPASPVYGSTHESIPAEMSAGSVLIWHGSLWHGGGANKTADRRIGMAMNYCAGFIRPQENQELGIPIDIARTFSPRLQELCGYSIYRGLIGHIDKHHPRELLDPTTDTSMLWDRS